MLTSGWVRLALAAAGVGMGLAAHAQPSRADAGQEALRLLQQQGQYWQDRGDYKRAAESWEKLLQVQPESSRAFYGMGLGALQQHDLAGARQWLERLRAQNGNAAAHYAALLDQAIHFERQDAGAALEEARTLVVSRDLEAAIAKYDEALAGQAPQGELAFEYYNYLGYTKNGLAAAIKGLETLLKSEPGNKGYELGLAKHLVRDLKRRQEGLRRLQALSAVPAVASEAQEAWRVALTWIGPPTAEYRPFFESYLALGNDDAEIRQLLQQATQAREFRARPASQTTAVARKSSPPAVSESAKPWVQDARITAGMQALEKGELQEAERYLLEAQAALPRNADVLGGLGLVRMKQQDFAAAEILLARAVRGSKAWQPALETARYWKFLADAGRAQENAEYAAAYRLVARAQELDTQQTASFNRLAHIQAAEQKWEDAEASYRAVLVREPGNIEALHGLVYVLEMSGRPREALLLVQGLTPALQAEFGDMMLLRQRVAQLRVQDALARGNDEEIEAALLEVMRYPTDKVWPGYELARLYLRQGDPASARSVMEEVLRDEPEHPDAAYAAALIAEQRGDWHAVRTLLARVPSSQHGDKIPTLMNRARFWLDLDDARQAARQGETARAAALLSGLEQERGLTIVQLTEVADAMIEASLLEQGLMLMRRLVPVMGTSEAGVGVMLRYGAALVQTGQLVEADIVLRQLQSADLNQTEREALLAISQMQQEKQARPQADPASLDAARGLLAAAVASRQPGKPPQVARQEPEHQEQLLMQYRATLESDPGNVEVALQAAEVAGRQGDVRYMETVLGNAVALSQEDTEVLARAAKLARQYGRAAQAEDFYQAAVRVGQQQHSVDAGTLAAWQDELAALRAERNVEVRWGVMGRANNGEAGSSRMREVSTPLEVRLPAGSGTVALRATPVWLDAGTAAADAGVLTNGSVGHAGAQRDSGVGVSVAYESDSGVTMDLGTTPLGFQRTNVVGGLSVQGALSQHTGYGVEVSRRAVTDSLLSYAGTRDAQTDEPWGGVTATGALARLGWDDGATGVYGYGSWHALRGKNVRSNGRIAGGVGVYRHLYETADERWTAGVHAGAVGYQRNLRFFSWGHGGYFSPQSMYMLNFPVTWAKRGDDFSYRLQGAIGIQHFKEDSADYFPTDASRQAAAELAAAQAAGASGAAARYDGQSHTGVAYNLAAAAEYRLNQQWVLGGSMTMDNARDYRQWGGGVYLRYWLHPVAAPLALPLEPYRSPYNRP